ncbi:MAG: serine hydrolase [Gammaproteobacteria bacterium]|nr:serine hydrolase [Gammaproteobacteria bacterium]MDH4310062.1 serine hydrolase [Gammaproteobacteria bacterium]MDH5272686.1 serine hydrolase [Gammaproteobacteria bacterium]
MRSWHKRIGSTALAGLLLTVFASTAALAAAQGTALPGTIPDVRSHAYYVLDESAASVLAARNEHIAVPIASITKLMTALVVLEGGQSMDQLVTINADDVRGTAGNASRLASGYKLSRRDLLHLALMSSENRAAYALCRAYPRGLRACVQAMNKKAVALGMTSAHFVEPTGLSSGNVASPVDLAKLVLAAAGNRTIRDYSTSAGHTVTVNRRQLEFHNTNLLVANPAWRVDVQKTGYIPEAGRCLVMQTVIDGRPVVMVLLNSYGKYTRIADAKRVRTWLESRSRVAAL